MDLFESSALLGIDFEHSAYDVSRLAREKAQKSPGALDDLLLLVRGGRHVCGGGSDAVGVCIASCWCGLGAFGGACVRVGVVMVVRVGTTGVVIVRVLP